MFSEGETIGVYELIRRLGGGAFGEVWLVRHMELGAERAMKIPTDPDYVRQLRQEGKIQFQLGHPNIVETVDLNTMRDPPYFVMEYVEGSDLRQRLKASGKLPVAEALDILRQILDALDHAHAQGVLHRDLKPENILMTADGCAKITDFGLGKVQAEIAQSLLLSGSMMSSGGTSVGGTYDYMSPEQRRAEEPDPRDDIWAVGIIACELLTGRRPGGRIDRVLSRGGVPQPLIDVIDKACEDPDYRYATAAEMRRDLDAADGKEASEPVGSTSPSVKEIAPEPEPEPSDDVITNAAGIKLKLIQPGTFFMKDGGTERWITLAKPYYMGVYPVTQAQWDVVMAGMAGNPSEFKGPNRLVECTPWDAAVAFCHILSVKEGGGVKYRLPTEAEWEYACRAGATTEFCFGDDEKELKEYAWYKDNGGKETHDVGQKKPNAWGLYDMHGNVCEWCQDWKGKYGLPGNVDPTGPPEGKDRILRGGSWYNEARYCRATFRLSGCPDLKLSRYGFRVVKLIQ